MCNVFFACIRNALMPVHIKKEIEKMHDATISHIWNEIYDKIDIIGETGTIDELTIRFPLERIYEIDGFWKKYNYETIDFGFYTIKLNSKMDYSYKDMPIEMDFYSDGRIGFLEIARK
jgi:hypothetical protein